MDEDTILKETDSETSQEQSSPSTETNPLQEYLILTVLLILPFCWGGYIGYMYAPEKVAERVVEVERVVQQEQGSKKAVITDEPQVVNGKYVSNIANISFQVPDGWKLVDTIDADMPAGMKRPAFHFVNTKDSCVISGVDFSRDAADYKQVAHATRVTTDSFQFDGTWYLDQSLVTTPTEYQETRPYLPGLLRVSVTGRIIEFVLWSPNEGVVSDDCDSDLNALLETVEYYYEDIDIQPEDQGYLQFKTDFMRNGSRKFRLMYTNSEEESYSVMDVRDGAGHGTDIFVYQNKLISYSSNIGPDDLPPQTGLDILDPFTETSEIIAPTELSDEVITSVYVVGSEVYLTTTPRENGFCMDKGPCELSFYKIDLISQELTSLGGPIAGNEIMGYSQEDNTFYFSGGYGDGGCLGLHFSAFTGGEVIPMGNYGGCYGADGEDEGLTELYKVRSSIEQNLTSLEAGNALSLTDGLLIPVETGSKKSYTKYYLAQ